MAEDIKAALPDARSDHLPLYFSVLLDVHRFIQYGCRDLKDSSIFVTWPPLYGGGA